MIRSDPRHSSSEQHKANPGELKCEAVSSCMNGGRMEEGCSCDSYLWQKIWPSMSPCEWLVPTGDCIASPGCSPTQNKLPSQLIPLVELEYSLVFCLLKESQPLPEARRLRLHLGDQLFTRTSANLNILGFFVLFFQSIHSYNWKINSLACRIRAILVQFWVHTIFMF